MKHTFVKGLYIFTYDLEGQAVITYDKKDSIAFPVQSLLDLVLEHCRRSIAHAYDTARAVDLLRSLLQGSTIELPKPNSYEYRVPCLTAHYTWLDDAVILCGTEGTTAEGQHMEVMPSTLESFVQDYITTLDRSKK